MDLSTDIVDLLGQVSLAIPVVSSFQPIFGGLKLILERAQKMSDDKKKLATLAVRSARLGLTLHEQIATHADHLGDRVKAKLDEINGIVNLILSEFKRLDKKPAWRQLSKSKNITDKVLEFYDDLKASIENCQLVLGVDISAKLTLSSHLIRQTHERVCNFETEARSVKTQLVQFRSTRAQIDPDSSLEIIPRSELCLTKPVDTRQIMRIKTGEIVTITTHDAIWNDTVPVRVKYFRSAASSTSKHAFETELSRCKELWTSFLSQPRGHSDRTSSLNYIIYHSPVASTRVPFNYLLDQHISSDFAMTLRLLFSVQDLIRRWGEVSPVFPFTQYDDGREFDFKCERWADNIMLDSKLLDYSQESVSPIFQGDLCVMETNSAIGATDSLMEWLARWLRSRCCDLPLVNTIHKAVIVRWDDPNSIAFPSSLPMSVDGINRSLQEKGWLSLSSKPSLFADEIEIQLSNNWEWLRGSEMTSFLHRFWNVELGCDTSEQLYWWSELDFGYHYVFCLCGEKQHGDIYRRIDRLQIIWLGTPLDGLEFRSADYIEGRQYDWEIYPQPSLPIWQTGLNDRNNDDESTDADGCSESDASGGLEEDSELSDTVDSSSEEYYSAEDCDD